MTNTRRVLSALFPMGMMLALAACINPVIIGGNDNGSGGSGNSGSGMGGSGNGGEGGASLACMTDADCNPGQLCVNGVCSPGQPCGCPDGTMCDASGMCVPVCPGTVETCNGIDDDCDGAIDEQDNPMIPLCADGTVCVMGQCGGPNVPCMTDADCGPMRLCVNGMCTVNGCTPEVCNGIDDDCNGVIDDGTGAFCADGTICLMGQCAGNPQQCGPNSPPCPMGQVCTAMGVCVPGDCMPTVETCNGFDDDCDGVIDDATPGTTLCPNGGMCANGQCIGGQQPCGPNAPCPAGQMCSAAMVCVPGMCQPAPETCNGLDDDCDGLIDEVTPGAILCPNGGTCVNGQCTALPPPCGPMNPCPAGQMCSANGVCVGACQPVPETCNGLDDDCDGVVDDTAAGTTLCPNGICFAGKCTISCQNNAQCPMGTTCTNGICQ